MVLSGVGNKKKGRSAGLFLYRQFYGLVVQVLQFSGRSTDCAAVRTSAGHGLNAAAFVVHRASPSAVGQVHGRFSRSISQRAGCFRPGFPLEFHSASKSCTKFDH
jgi:hypothetical protein